MLDIIALHALFGSSIPISKKLLGFVSPVLLTGIRMSIAGFLLVGFTIIRKKKIDKIPKHVWWQYAQIVFVGVYLKYILRSWGLAHMPAIKLVFLLNVAPFVAAFLSYLAFRETLTRVQWIGLCIGIIGTIPILLTSSGEEQLIGELFFISWPECVVFFSIVAHCYGLVVARTLVRDNNHSASLTNGIRMLGGGLLALITSFFVEDIYVHNMVPFLGWLGILIIISNVICHNLYLRLLKQYTVTFVSLTDFLSPLFSALYSWLLLNETITWHYAVSGIIVFFGLYLFHRDELKAMRFQGVVS